MWAVPGPEGVPTIERDPVRSGVPAPGVYGQFNRSLLTVTFRLLRQLAECQPNRVSSNAVREFL